MDLRSQEVSHEHFKLKSRSSISHMKWPLELSVDQGEEWDRTSGVIIFLT